jgi:hypothetical protein
MKKNRWLQLAALISCGLVSCGLLSCGIEDYKYLQPVTSIMPEGNSKATIYLPTSSSPVIINFPNYGSYPNISDTSFLGDYVIYYRIYKSPNLIPSVNTHDARNSVNASLATDYTTFEPYTAENNNSTSSIDSLFLNRRYYQLRADSSGNLLRSNNSNAFTLEPDPYFINSSTILTTTPSAVLNYDVADVTTTEKRYTYASMYIAQIDFNPQTLTPVYSRPSFINIFLLPEPISSVPVTGITLSPTTMTLSEAATFQLTATIMPSTASNKGVIWTSSSPTIAEVDSDTGLITAIAPGTTTITATTINGGFSATCAVTVIE